MNFPKNPFYLDFPYLTTPIFTPISKDSERVLLLLNNTKPSIIGNKNPEP